MSKEQLFINILDDLKQKIESGDSYQLLKSTELIRSLLFDTTGPLVDKINRQHKLKIKYEYLDSRTGYPESIMALNPKWFVVGDGFYPKWLITNGNIISTKKEKFFSMLIMRIDGREITTKELIDYVLYCMGGTHHSDPKELSELALKKMEDIFFMNTTSAISQIRSIGMVILDSLQELKEQVKRGI